MEQAARFLEEVVPVAEEAGVQLAAHPDDPPLPTLRQQPRLIYQPFLYQRLIDLVPSKSNALELCVGTLGEMTEEISTKRLTNIASKVRSLTSIFATWLGRPVIIRETFIDEGEVDMIRVLTILKANGFGGMIIPDHTPQMSCAAPWHAGMAHTLGFVLAVFKMLEGNGK